MRPRRAHRKSHNGCQQCKKRHVKCDEEGDICGPCTKRELLCSFQGAETPQSKLSTPPKDTVPEDKSAERVQSNRVLELELFHHFSTTTCVSLGRNSLGTHVLQISVPKMALTHSFLLETILALSAIHLAYLDTTKSKPWLQIALQYQDRALVGFNQTLANVTSDNCEAVAVCSMLVLLLTMAVPGVYDNNESTDPVSELLSQCRLIQGIHHILLQFHDVLQNGELATWFKPHLEYNAWQKSPPDPLIDPQQKRTGDIKQSYSYESMVQALKRLCELINRYEGENQEAYRNACQSLQGCISPSPSDKSMNDIIAWLPRASPLILSSLEMKDPMACLLFVHYGVALNFFVDKWYARGSGKRLVRALLPAIPGEWADITEWARQSVGIIE